MNAFFVVVMVLLMAAVLGVLLTGVLGMLRGGEFNKQHGNKLMRWRVMLQLAAVLVFALVLLSSG